MNYIRKLWRGDVSLVVTFWVWYIFLSLIVSVIHDVVVLWLSGYPAIVLVVVVLLDLMILLYLVFITVAVWRSATKYQGKYIWELLAKTLIAFGWARMILSLFFPDLF